MPPVWEYRAGGYRRPSQLSADLGMVARYVGIDLLFTTSPLYDPLVTAPDVGGSKVAHVAMLEDDPGSSGLRFINTAFARRELRSFEPYYSWKVGRLGLPRRGDRGPGGIRAGGACGTADRGLDADARRRTHGPSRDGRPSNRVPPPQSVQLIREKNVSATGYRLQATGAFPDVRSLEPEASYSFFIIRLTVAYETAFVNARERVAMFTG